MGTSVASIGQAIDVVTAATDAQGTQISAYITNLNTVNANINNLATTVVSTTASFSQAQATLNAAALEVNSTLPTITTGASTLQALTDSTFNYENGVRYNMTVGILGVVEAGAEYLAVTTGALNNSDSEIFKSLNNMLNQQVKSLWFDKTQ